MRFAKIYEEAPRSAYWVDYVGTTAESDEIQGRWEIVNWSGTFLMVRERGAEKKAAELESVESRA